MLTGREMTHFLDDLFVIYVIVICIDESCSLAPSQSKGKWTVAVAPCAQLNISTSRSAERDFFL